jgi:hypothetical protein
MAKSIKKCGLLWNYYSMQFFLVALGDIWSSTVLLPPDLELFVKAYGNLYING